MVMRTTAMHDMSTPPSIPCTVTTLDFRRRLCFFPADDSALIIPNREDLPPPRQRKACLRYGTRTRTQASEQPNVPGFFFRQHVNRHTSNGKHACPAIFQPAALQRGSSTAIRARQGKARRACATTRKQACKQQQNTRARICFSLDGSDRSSTAIKASQGVMCTTAREQPYS